MAYSFKTLEQVVQAFGLRVSSQVLFDQCPAIEPTEFFKLLLKRELDWAKAVGTEKARRGADFADAIGGAGTNSSTDQRFFRTRI